MTTAIFGATGNYGGDVLDYLTARNVPSGELLALGRNSERLGELASRGFRTAQIDLNRPEGLRETLNGVEVALLISTADPQNRMTQHRNAIDAARSAGVQHVVYTSVLQAPTTPLILAPDHKATEQYITESGIAFTFLRNGWYTENHHQEFDLARARGIVANSVGEGRIASAPRRDFAEAAAVVLTTEGHREKSYELTGDVAWNFDEFAATAASVLGTQVVYAALSAGEEHEQLRGVGLDEATAGFVVALHANMRDDVLAMTTSDLQSLIGRPTETLEATLANWR